MTAPRRSFQDIADKRFTVPDAFKARAILNCLVFERGTRSFGIRLVEAGIDDYKDLEGKTVDEIVTRVAWSPNAWRIARVSLRSFSSVAVPCRIDETDVVVPEREADQEQPPEGAASGAGAANWMSGRNAIRVIAVLPAALRPISPSASSR